MQVLLGHLSVWGVTARNILLDPLLLPHADYFSGLTFQAYLVQLDTGAATLVAVGVFANMKATEGQSNWNGVIQSALPIMAVSVQEDGTMGSSRHYGLCQRHSSVAL